LTIDPTDLESVIIVRMFVRLAVASFREAISPRATNRLAPGQELDAAFRHLEVATEHR